MAEAGESKERHYEATTMTTGRPYLGIFVEPNRELAFVSVSIAASDG